MLAREIIPTSESLGISVGVWCAVASASLENKWLKNIIFREIRIFYVMYKKYFTRFVFSVSERHHLDARNV